MRCFAARASLVGQRKQLSPKQRRRTHGTAMGHRRGKSDSLTDKFTRELLPVSLPLLEPRKPLVVLRTKK